MIGFMHYLRSEDSEAKAIHGTYGNDAKVFIEKAREFLSKQDGRRGGDGHGPDHPDISSSSESSVNKEPTDPTKNAHISNMEADRVASSSKPAEDIHSHHLNNMEKMVANLTLEHDDSSNIHHSPRPIQPPKPVQNVSPVPPMQTPIRPPLGMQSVGGGMVSPGIVIPPTPPPTPLRDENVPVAKGITGLPPPGLPTIAQVMANTPQHTLSPTSRSSNNNIQTTPIRIQTPEIPSTPVPPPATPAAPPPKWQPKRLNMRLQEQPGRILANQFPATFDGSNLTLGPREELTATWQLPLGYLRERTLTKLAKAKEDGDVPPSTTPESLTIRDALRSLTVGLFRRGCSENGTSSSIISKEVVPVDRTQKEYQFEINHQTHTIWGTVPFFTPRTPGNVVLRLYFEDDPVVTLATSPCISIVVSSKRLEPTLRFILSNFKTKRGSTNFSSIHSLAAVFEQYVPSQFASGGGGGGGGRHNHYNAQMDGAGRAGWGGICESRKIVDSCRQDYLKKKAKLDKAVEALELTKDELDAKIDAEKEEEGKSLLGTDPDANNDGETVENEELKDWREKMNQTMGERASNERKWREIQMAFASVLKSVIDNPHSSSLLKPDIIKKLELEYYLWCPLCENFALNPFEDENGGDGGTANIKYPYPIQTKHFRACIDSRVKMQQEILGFAVKNTLLPSNVFQGGNGLSLSNAMITFYKLGYGDHAESSYKKKSMARELAENAVSRCNAFPQGTKVVVFGSSANGFGSPKSDLDMCLQLPEMSTFAAEQGPAAMEVLAEHLIEAGMLNVNTARLTARIPVIQFECRVEVDGVESIIECDISMQNPLACVNTSLLKTYSLVTPTVRIIASIVKRWAKRRNINDPSHHTLSSYGYILMLLHFLTTHKANKNGEIESIFSKTCAECPLLPNLQWCDPRFLQNPPGTPYLEFQQKPANQYTTMKHPTEDSYVVNTHFLRINDQKVLNLLKLRMEQCSPPPPSVGYLLAAFFRYYAFEFDYKKHIVSLQAISSTGVAEREAKAESDGWKLYGQALCIEDPFEEFYDVAHVLKPVNFQRTRREFALAYSKIHSSISDNSSQLDGEKLLDLICEELSED